MRLNSNRDAVLHGRTFELRVPLSIETCVARLEKQAAGEAKVGLRFSKVTDALYAFELHFAPLGISEVIGRGSLEAIEDGHTLVSGRIGSNTSVTNVIIVVWVLIGLGILGWLWSINSSYVLGWVYGVLAVVSGLYQPIGRLRFFDARLRWIQAALDKGGAD